MSPLRLLIPVLVALFAFPALAQVGPGNRQIDVQRQLDRALRTQTLSAAQAQRAGVSQRSAQRGSLPQDPTPGSDGGYGYTWYDGSEQVALREEVQFVDGFDTVDISFDGDWQELFDDDAVFVTMGLSSGFPYYGNTYSQVAVHSNGYLSFTSTAADPFGNLGESSEPNAVIAGYWTDLDPENGDGVYTYDDFEDGREVFVVQWSGIPSVDLDPEDEEDPPTYTFQIRLYEDGEIRIIYGPQFFDDYSATVGIESPDASHVINAGDELRFGSRRQLGNILVFQPPKGNGLVVGPYAAPGEALDFVFVTEPCGSQPSRVQEFVVLNTSGSSLSLSPSISGDPEFQILSAPSGSIPPGEEAYIEVAFVGQVGSGGSRTSDPVGNLKTATLTTGASPATISLEGHTIATTVSPHERMADGYATRTSVTACNNNPAPAAALLPFGPGTTDQALDISFNDPDSLTLATPFRLYGEPYSKVYFNYSGAITFETPDVSGPFRYDLPLEDPTTAMVAPFLLGYSPIASGPSVTPGAAYAGLRDVTGDGVQDLVVTFYRVPATFDGYLTWQAVLAPNSTPGANGTIRYQYFVSDDPVDGEPYSALYDATLGGNYFGTAGISGDQGGLGVETRSRAFWAFEQFPVAFDKTVGDVAFELTPRSEMVMGSAPGSDVAGWRLFSAPGDSMTVRDFAEQNFVQGLSDSYPLDNDDNPANPTFFISYDGTTGFAPPDSLGQLLPPGEGILWYVFDIDLLPQLDPGNSQSYVLPSPLVAAGNVQTETVSVPLTATTPSGIRWEMMGNPFEEPLDLTSIASWATGGSLGSAIGQLWDPATESYVLSSDPSIGDELAVWQGMFIEGGTATALEIPYPVASSREARQSNQVVAFRLQGQGTDGTAAVDRSTVLSVRPDATDGYDLYDAIKLDASGPVLGSAGRQVMLAFVGERDGEEVLKAQESRPASKGFSVPLLIESTDVTRALTLSWEGLDALQGNWRLRLEDVETGEETDLFGQESLAFEHASSTSGRTATRSRSLTAQRRDANAGHRFVLHVLPGQPVNSETVPTTETVALVLDGPNPVSAMARLELAMPEAGYASVSVFDVMGREVARLLDASVPAGRRQLEWDTSGAAPGTYMVRLAAGGEMQTLKLLVVR